MKCFGSKSFFLKKREANLFGNAYIKIQHKKYILPVCQRAPPGFLEA